MAAGKNDDVDDDFELEVQDEPAGPTPKAKKPKSKKSKAPNAPAQIVSYRHPDKRVNNPEVGMVHPENDPDEPKTVWRYDPHIDPALQFDSTRSRVEALIDEALESGDQEAMHAALFELKRLQLPYLNWTGRAERTSFEVDTVSLHVHERIDPASILAAVRRKMKSEKGTVERPVQPGLFDAPFEALPLRQAVDFYKHEKSWSNRLIAGDSLLIMNSLLKKESMAGQIQMIYIDPPYGIKYGSNFQPFTNKRDVKDGADADLTQEPEMIKAFRDTWELGIHSYLTYLRDRLLMARSLLHASGSIFVQIGDENLHLVRQLLDEVFGAENFSAQIAFKATDPLGQKGVARVYDHLLWYAKSRAQMKFRGIYRPRNIADDNEYRFFDLFPGEEEPSRDSERFRTTVYRRRNATSSGFTESCTFDLEFQGERFPPPGNKSWSSNSEGMARLIRANRLFLLGKDPYYKQFNRDFPLSQYENCWTDKPAAQGKKYVVETAAKFVERCLLMTTDPGDLILDPTCGSGTTAFVAEKWGRRWITCDTSRVAITLAKQRLMTASYDYYTLRYPHEGLKGGFSYKTVPHVTLKSIANNPEIDEIFDALHPAVIKALDALNQQLKSVPTFTVLTGTRKDKKLRLSAEDTLEEWEVPVEWPNEWPANAQEAFEQFHHARRALQSKIDSSITAHAEQEVLYDDPEVDRNRQRIVGPFSVEAVPNPTVISLDKAQPSHSSHASIVRTGETSRQSSWRDELMKAGVRGKGGQKLKFAELETIPGLRNLHTSGALDTGERVVVSFGPEHAALEQRQVELALKDAEKLRPSPKFVVFCAFAFDPEAAKDIDEINWPGVTMLRVQMNTDLLTEDLKKGRASNESFWLMGQPDVELRALADGRWQVEVHGFDYFDTKQGELVSGGKNRIAMWSLDPDYDQRSLFPHQVFFPIAGKKDGWQRLKKTIRAELDESLLDKFNGTVSLPFEAGENQCVAVKIVDDRGIESLKVIPLNR
ncbi:site-specific DNA-methyltransferase [Bradyrhizobium sp. SZCCHNRI1073]|uniref:site-specific DNA-methyltransferase n=1 Tax=Bradyrhizobium sp. SZCCHNRI1073 TaxID=3057280 RepID=UPI00291625CD|nr:site-specific DNA-methyltransferase [Bradyrhizobium sp. SZCCHNRI1073]